MAVVNVKGTIITNRDATPRVLSPAGLSRGVVKSSQDYVAVTSGDSIASVYRILPNIPGNAYMLDLLLSCTAITTCAGDIGVYRTTADGGAVVDVDLFATAQSLAAALEKTRVLREATTITIATQNSPLWSLLGYTSDPGYEFDICITLTAAAGSAGTMGLLAFWAQ